MFDFGQESNAVRRCGESRQVRLLCGGFAVLLGGLVLAFPVWRWGSTAIASGGPRLELSTDRLDLGEGKPNETLRGELTLRNSGSKDLEFEIRASCGCSELTPRTGTIAPGDQRDIRLAVKLPGHLNSERNVRITVVSNDPQRPEASCSVAAVCPAPFRVTPAFVDFGRVAPGVSGIKPVEIRMTPREGEERPVRSRLSGEGFVISQDSGVVRVLPRRG